MKTKFAWHVHHDILVEPLTEPIKVRREFIRSSKPPHEVATRLRLLKAVKGRLPAKLVEAGKAYVEALTAYDEAWKAAMPAILRLHAKECKKCPWDGETIFPGART